MNGALVSIIIVNWNGKKWLEKCLGSILNQSYKNFEIIIVDNDSKDDSVSYLKANYKMVNLICNNENSGFGKANNIGVKHAKGEILFFVNNDTVLHERLIEDLVNYKQKNALNVLGPKILNYNGVDINQGRRVSIDVTGYLGWGKETFFIEGSALMIDKSDFLKLRGFDEKYFMYSEDIDLCWRALIYGMKVGICDNATMLHFCGGSSEQSVAGVGETEKKQHVIPSFRRYEVEKNNFRNVLKNYQAFNLIWAIPACLFMIFLESMFYVLSRNFKMFKLVWSSVLWNVKNIGNTIKERKVIQSERVVSDLTILKMMNFKPNKIFAFLYVGIPKFK